MKGSEACSSGKNKRKQNRKQPVCCRTGLNVMIPGGGLEWQVNKGKCNWSSPGMCEIRRGGQNFLKGLGRGNAVYIG
jgi:hypothetical protein